MKGKHFEDVPFLLLYSGFSFEYTFWFILCLVVVFYVKFLWNRRKLYIYSWKIEGPFALPIIGAAHHFLGLNSTGFLKKAELIQSRYKKIVKVWIGHKLHFIIKDPKYIEKILTSPETVEKDYFYENYSAVLGPGIFTNPDRIWKKERKLLGPTMNKLVLNRYINKFSECGLEFVQYLDNHIGESDLDLTLLAAKYSTDTFIRTSMCAQNVPKHIENIDLGYCLKCITKIGSAKYLNIFYHINALWSLTTLKKEFDKYVNLMHKVTKSYIQMRKSEHNRINQYTHTESFTEKPETITHFLDTLFQDNNFTEDEIASQAETFLAAATEPVSIAICSVLIMLAMYPDMQEKVYEEAVAVLGQDGGVTDYNLPLLKYTERVIKETLRLFPPALIFSRLVTKDLDLGDVVLPEGSSATIMPLFIHRNSEYWDEPLKFDPDRFLPEKLNTRHPCTFIPFSFGPRNCIGHQFGMMTLKTVIAMTVRQFHVHTHYNTIEDIDLTFGPVFSFALGDKVRFERRIEEK
ncbi:hypothetical protein C4B38_000102 [Diabrotica virgifera virgifera]|uniref:Cytochrome P450 4C1-like isoform X1 n=2 Tax=Diabrotica virgifera virgifera TaxID=50390 RepID=A0A6P7FAE0_DIAVI|nr:hypothetical protein C4B38_000102 [Diabrotica virgifera virgifera]